MADAQHWRELAILAELEQVKGSLGRARQELDQIKRQVTADLEAANRDRDAARADLDSAIGDLEATNKTIGDVHYALDAAGIRRGPAGADTEDGWYPDARVRMLTAERDQLRVQVEQLTADKDMLRRNHLRRCEQIGRAAAAAQLYAERVDALGLAADDNDPLVMATAEPIGAAQADLFAALGLLVRDASGKASTVDPTETVEQLRAERDAARTLAKVRARDIPEQIAAWLKAKPVYDIPDSAADIADDIRAGLWRKS